MQRSFSTASCLWAVLRICNSDFSRYPYQDTTGALSLPGESMTEDLLSLRLLLVGASKPERELWSQGVARASVPIEFYTQESGHSAWPKGGVDILLIDAALSQTAVTAVVRTARSLQPQPLVLVCGGSRRERPPGVDGLLPRPAVVEEARRLIDVCVRARLPNRVLIVDDSSTMRAIVRKILSASRFPLQLEESADGE